MIGNIRFICALSWKGEYVIGVVLWNGDSNAATMANVFLNHASQFRLFIVVAKYDEGLSRVKLVMCFSHLLVSVPSE
jgi:hypothetical protein